MAVQTYAEYLLEAEGSPIDFMTRFDMVQRCKVISLLPFDTLNEMEWAAKIYETLPSMSWIAMDESPGSSRANPQIRRGQMSLMAQHVDIPEVILGTNSGRDEFERQYDLLQRALDRFFNQAFVYGNRAVNDLAIDGLQTYVQAMPSTQTVYPEDLAQFDISDVTGFTRGTAAKLYQLLDEMLYRVDGLSRGTGSAAIFASHRFVSALIAMDRIFNVRGDNFNWTGFRPFGDNVLDQSIAANNPQATYNGHPVYNLGPDLTGRDILRDNYAAPVTSTAGNEMKHTRIFAVRLGAQHVSGVQLSGPVWKDVGGLEDTMVKRMRFSWPTGMRVVSNRSIAQLGGIKVTM